MLAHLGARAGCSRMSLRGEVYPPPPQESKITKSPPNLAKNGESTPSSVSQGRPAWKYAYEEFLWSKQKLPLNLRAILQVLVRLSDHLGRIWWSQAAIAEQAGCTVRTLRRLLPALEAGGHARVERMTFRRLAVAQAALGLPLPGRNDDGQGPDLITLLFEGRPAVDLRPAGRRRLSGPGQVVTPSPRTSLSPKASENSPNPGDRSSADPRDLSIDLYRNVGDPKTKTPPPSHLVLITKPTENASTSAGATPSQTPNDSVAWQVLEAAYDVQFKRVYQARPTNKPLAVESRLQMGGHLADMADVLRARFVERNTDLTTLPKPPVELLAEEALRAWFDSSGTNDYLRRVSHRMTALPADLPYRIRKAIEALLERYAPKPEPRRAVLPLGSLLQTVGRVIPTTDKPKPPFVAETAREIPTSKPTVVKTTPSHEVLIVLAGLSQHAALHDLSQTPTVAHELLLMAKENNSPPARIVEALEIAAKVCQRKRMASSAERADIVYKVVGEVLLSSGQTSSTA